MAFAIAGSIGRRIFNRGMVPNINANPRGRRATKRGRKPLFDAAIVKERFHTVERVFSWEELAAHLTHWFRSCTK